MKFKALSFDIFLMVSLEEFGWLRNLTFYFEERGTVYNKGGL